MDTTLSPEKAALHRAATVLGGQAAMAVLLGYSDRRGVWAYFHTDRKFPAEHCPIIERATREKGDVVRCEELRRDIAWDVLRAEGATEPEPTKQKSHRTDKATASDGKGGKAKPAPVRSSKPKAITGALPVTEHAKA